MSAPLPPETLNALDLAIIRGRLMQIADEMDAVHKRAAFSPIITEAADRANSIIDAERLETVTQGATGLPIFVATMQAAARSMMPIVGNALREGDVVMMNVPYLGGTHLQDIKLMRPYYVDGKLAILLVNTGHYMDLGSATPGGFDPNSETIFQEGLQIPPVFLMRDGVLCEDVVRMFLQNTRLPEAQTGDLHAQLNALEIGARRIDALVAEQGGGKLLRAIAELGDRSEQHMRLYLNRIANGTYVAQDVVEIDTENELSIKLALTVKDGSVDVDFAGSSAPYFGPMNLARPTTESAVMLAFKHLFPEVPLNGGCFRPIRFRFPENSFLAVESPYAVGGYAESSQRVMDTVFAALAQAMPKQAWGIDFGTSGQITMNGYDQGRFFSCMIPMTGGYGGSLGSDGLANAALPIGIGSYPTLETMEHDFPIIWEAMTIREDSAGPGKWRGGPGTIFRIRVTVPVSMTFLGDRARHAPLGIEGGGPAAKTEIEIHTAKGILGGPGHSRLGQVMLEAGDVVEMRSPGGGGYGLPAERDPADLAEDVADRITSATAASVDYPAVTLPDRPSSRAA